MFGGGECCSFIQHVTEVIEQFATEWCSVKFQLPNISIPFIALEKSVEFDGHLAAQRHSEIQMTQTLWKCICKKKIIMKKIINKADERYLLWEAEHPVLMRWPCVFSLYSSSSASVKNQVYDIANKNRKCQIIINIHLLLPAMIIRNLYAFA